MRLRGNPPRVKRLSRKVLGGLALVTSLGLGAALIYALQTRDGRKPTEELYSTDNRATADGLAGLPHDYSAIPKLGPPLPGDLGRPILSAQNRGQIVPSPAIGAAESGPSAEDQRRQQEIETARTAKLFAIDPS
jgi:type IV secretion system protein TrbI